MELRPYQAEAKAAVFEQWDKGSLKTLLVLPTGCGKDQKEHEPGMCDRKSRADLSGELVPDHSRLCTVHAA